MFMYAVWAFTIGAIWAILPSRELGMYDNEALFPFVIIGAAVPLAIALVLILLMRRPQPREAPAEGEAQAA